MSKLTEKIKDMTDEELEILVWNAMRRRPYERISDNTHAMLDTAFAHIHSVPYQVSERWVFYRLWQEGVWWKTDTVDAKAKAADDFNSKLSRARHTQFRGWHPNILKSDEDYLSHEVVGNPTIASALEILPEILEASVYLPLDALAIAEVGAQVAVVVELDRAGVVVPKVFGCHFAPAGDGFECGMVPFLQHS